MCCTEILWDWKYLKAFGLCVVSKLVCLSLQLRLAAVVHVLLQTIILFFLYYLKMDSFGLAEPMHVVFLNNLSGCIKTYVCEHMFFHVKEEILPLEQHKECLFKGMTIDPFRSSITYNK